MNGTYYRKYSDGFIIQGGYYYKGSSTKGTNTITFPIPFGNTLFTFSYDHVHNHAGVSNYYYGENVNVRTTNSVTFNFSNDDWFGWTWTATGY